MWLQSSAIGGHWESSRDLTGWEYNNAVGDAADSDRDAELSRSRPFIACEPCLLGSDCWSFQAGSYIYPHRWPLDHVEPTVPLHMNS